MFIISKIRVLFENIFSFHTKRKIICFESDDWGSVRMPSFSVYEKTASFDSLTAKNVFLMNDCLESKDDIKNLCHTLSKFSDSSGRHPSFTFYYVPYNPDFKKISADNCSQFYYESTIKTYSDYYGKDEITKAILNGLNERLLNIQFHAAWHLNERRWIKDAKLKKNGADYALNNRICGGIGLSFKPNNRFGYMDTYNYDYIEELDAINKSFKLGREAIKKMFNINELSGITCPCFVWDDCVERTISTNGFKYISSIVWQLDCHKKVGTIGKRRLRLMGRVNRKTKIMYIIRNCDFEIAENPNRCVDLTFEQIKRCFSFNVPAVINTHRMNYVSGINKNNATLGLKSLEELLTKVLIEYPDVEFLSSAELSKIIYEHKNRNKKIN